MYIHSNAPRAKLPTKPYKPSVGDRSFGYISIMYAGSQRLGVHLRDILSSNCARLMEQPDDLPLQGYKYPSIKLYLSWPGYSSMSTIVNIDCVRLTRAQLAVLVTRHIASFMEKCSVLPVAAGNAQWRVGAGGISLNKCVLATVYNTGGDVWQAELEIEA